MENIRHSLDILLPWQRPTPKKQTLEKIGVIMLAALLAKLRNKDCKTAELGFLL